MVLSIPDGRSLRTLVNATPIRSADGDVESLIVTLQDLAPLDELERSRAEFLSMVSHELRAPLTSIKGSTATALGATPPPDPVEMYRILRIINEQADHMRGLINDLLDAGRIEAGTLSITPEPAEVAGLVDQARSTFPERRRPTRPAHRPAAGAVSGDGPPVAHRPGAQQPVVQRVEARARVDAHPGRGGAQRRSRGGLGNRRKAPA